MAFTARALFHGNPVEVTWDLGTLSGDVDAVRAIVDLAEQLEDRVVGLPTGPCTTTNHIQEPFSVLDLIGRVFIDGFDLVGDVPTLPDVPSGAIA